jgi:EAL domain-containing protein (putative c-di-GMP-specific phosphodiesterase class I)
MATSRVDEEIVTAMVGVARALGHETIAEFVEDEPTLELLRRLGVDYAQGYHVGVPVPAGNLAARNVT